MSEAAGCNTCCPTIEVTQVPGTEGDPGTDGANGANAYTTLAADLTLPAVNANVAATVANNTWMVVGQVIVSGDGTDYGTFRVVSKVGTTVATLTFLGAPGDGSPGAVIASGSLVSPGGSPQATPLAVASGGSGAATLTDRAVLIGRGTAAVNFAAPGVTGQPLLSTGAATNPAFSTIQAAIAAWGLKKTPLTVYAAGTSYQLTNTPAAVTLGTTSPALTIDAAGIYLILANARVDYNGATFAAVRTGTLKLRRTNNTAADLISRSFLTDIITTLSYTLGVIPIPPLIYTTTNSNDAIALYGDISVVPTAGSLDVSQAEIVAVRLFDQTA